MRRGLVYLILSALILLAFGRGVWALGEKSLWWDESLSLHRAKGSLEQVLTNEILLTDGETDLPTIDNHPPLYFLLLWVAVRLFGQSEFVLRFVSLSFAVLLVPLLYLTGRQLVDERTGIAAAALGAISPMALWYGQEARMYAMLAALGLLSVYCLVRAFFPNGERTALRHRWPWIVAYVVAAISLVLTHYLSALLVVFELAALSWFLLRQSASRRAIVLTVVLVAVGLAPLLVYGWGVQPLQDTVPGFTYVPLWMLLRDLLNSFSLGLSVDLGNWYVLLVDLLFLLMAGIGFAALVRPAAPRRWHGAGWLLIGYLLVPVVLIYLSSFVRPAYMTSRHLIFVSPAFSLLVAAGLTRWRGRSLWIPVLAGAIMVAGIGHSTVNYFSATAYAKPDHRSWGRYLREQVRPGDIVVVDPPHVAELYQYYAAGEEATWVGLPLLGTGQNQTEAKLEELRASYDRIWLAISDTPSWGDPELLPREWLNQHAFRFDFKEFHSNQSTLQIAGYLPAWPSVERLPDDAQPWDIQFNSSLDLKGFRLVTQAESGQDLHVQLFWSVNEPVQEQASVRLRLVDGQGHLWGQVDECPYTGLYPMWQWQPGLLLRDEHRLPLLTGTPPGAYELELELVQRPGGCAGGSGPAVPPLAAPIQAQRGNAVYLGPIEVRAAAEPPTMKELEIGQRHAATFDGLELLGSSVSAGDVEPGARLEVTLFWEAREPVPFDAKVRLRLLDQTGTLRAESVVRPVGGNHPTQLWQAGERLQGKFWLTVPPDAPEGQYSLRLTPEPPLQESGLWPALRRMLGAESGVKLGSLHVAAAQAGATREPVLAGPIFLSEVAALPPMPPQV